MKTTKTNKILVDRLLKLYNPYRAILGENARITQFRKKCYDWTKYEEVGYEPNYDKRKYRYHVLRCQSFMKDLEAVGRVFAGIHFFEPIIIDNCCFNGHITPQPVVIDGHHRLIAADLFGLKIIRVSYSGRIDLLRYLEGKRKTCPQE